MTTFDLVRHRSERRAAFHLISFRYTSWWTGDEFGPVSLASNAVVVEMLRIYKDKEIYLTIITITIF